MIKVYIGGTFDIPHIGHMIFFQQVKRFFPDSLVVVALNTDDFNTRFKGKPPVFSYTERLNYLLHMPNVDKVVPNMGNEDSRITILQEQPDVVVVGNDWLEKDYCKQMSFNADWLTEHKMALCFLPRIGGLSTTLIKEKLKNNVK
jgi:glycerol-3-phosphate cytidylyltransferase